MTDTLVLELSGGDGGPVSIHWTLIGSGAVLAEGWTEEAGEVSSLLPVEASPKQTLVLLPAEQIFARRILTPGRSERDARRAAPFLIEDQLAQPLDELDVVLGPAGDDGLRWVFAADKTLIAHWRKSALSAGVGQISTLPDALALPAAGAQLTLAMQRGRLLFSVPPAGGERDAEALSRPVCGALSEDLAAPVLIGLMRRLAPKIVRLGSDVDLNVLSEAGVPFQVDRMSFEGVAHAAAALDDDHLKQWPALLGERLGMAPDWLALSRPWRLAASMVVCAVLLTAIAAAFQASYLNMRTEVYYNAERTAFSSVFPDVRITRLRTQLNQQLASVGGEERGEGFLFLATVLSSILQDQDRIQIETLRYDAEQGVLSVTARYAGFDDFEVLRASAQSRGLVLEDEGARQGPRGVIGDFTVRRP